MAKISPIYYRKLARVFELAGFQKTREEGSHMAFTKSGIVRPIIIPKYRQVPIFIIKNNLRSGQISREEYFSLLKQAS